MNKKLSLSPLTKNSIVSMLYQKNYSYVEKMEQKRSCATVCDSYACFDYIYRFMREALLLFMREVTFQDSFHEGGARCCSACARARRPPPPPPSRPAQLRAITCSTTVLFPLFADCTFDFGIRLEASHVALVHGVAVSCYYAYYVVCQRSVRRPY